MAPTHDSNLDLNVAAGFGDEWTRFDHSDLSPAVQEEMFSAYFRDFPWEALGAGAVGADFGCGSGRWARFVAPRVGQLYCVDASAAALEVARRNLQPFSHCEFSRASVEDAPIPDGSLDFAYSLGVLHHMPDTLAGLTSCVRKLKPSAPFLLYLYYRFDNRPAWYRALWRTTNLARVLISRMPHGPRYWTSQVLAAIVYWPLARLAWVCRKLGIADRHVPLHYYADKPFYVMRTDALDRFGTRLEQRFTRAEMAEMMCAAGLRDVRFNDHEPFWCAVGYRAAGG
jgi:SAM-dependent methyltransferase